MSGSRSQRCFTDGSYPLDEREKCTVLSYMPRFPVFLLTLVLVSTVSAAGDVILEPIATGFDRPVQVVAAHDGSHSLYVAQQNGIILRLDPGQAPVPFLDIT